MFVLYSFSNVSGQGEPLLLHHFKLIFRYDYVQIIDGYGVNATQLARGCGTTSPGFTQSTGNVMIVKFRSDASVTRKGFKAYYKTGDECLQYFLLSFI